MGGTLKWGYQKSNFLTTHAGHMKFYRVGKYEEKIKFDRIWAYQNSGYL